VEAVLRAILRAGAYELKKRKDIPARVVIKEYTDIAGAFFEREEVGLANAVLDALAHRCVAANSRSGRAERNDGTLSKTRSSPLLCAAGRPGGLRLLDDAALITPPTA